MSEKVLTASEDDDLHSIDELRIAEYLLLLFAFDTYASYLDESEDYNVSTDSHAQRGLKLLKVIDQRLAEEMESFLESNVIRDVSKKAIKRTFRVRVSSAVHAARRALTLRTVLNRGGAATLKNIFEDSRARKSIKAAISSHMLDDPATALLKYAVIQVPNVRVKAWVRNCVAMISGEEAFVAQQAIAPSAPIEAAADTVSEAATRLKAQQAAEEGTTHVDEVQAAQENQTEILTTVQEEASIAAKAAIEASGGFDTPVNKSEVVGIATAAAIAASAEVGDSENIPASLVALDPEQRAAAMTDGRVLVAAGAGSGKSFTLVQRVKHLVEERKVPSSRVLVSSFNKKAAQELKHKIGKAVGDEETSAMTVGTLHGTFRRAILKYGTPAEKAMFQQGFVGTGSKVASAVNRVWRKCFAEEGDDGSMEDAQSPSAAAMMMHKTKWSGNDISPAQAMENATSPEAFEAARWYEWYVGFKGDLGPGWEPPCSGKAEARREWDRFVDKNRTKETARGSTVNIRLGDFDDMISVFRDILARNEEVRQRAQAAFDHVLIDECQDLNEIQHEVMGYLTAHITDGADGKSYWMIGDDKQSIYSFRGARPDLFTALDGAPGWNTRIIRTNYRCPPEIVEHANELISYNADQIEMEANPSPGRSRGQSSILVSTYADEAATAIDVAKNIKARLESDSAEVSDNAVLCRTNKELHSYETALLLKGIPYARKGASSFLGSPETKAFLGYASLVLDSDHEEMQKSFKSTLNMPNRFFVGPDKVERAVDYAVSQYARREGMTQTSVNPTVALRNYKFKEDLVYILKGVRKGFKADKAIDQLEALTEHLNELESLANQTATVDEETGEQKGPTTNDLFDSILEMPGMTFDVDPDTGRIRGEKEITFRSELTKNIKDFGTDPDELTESEEEEDDKMGLGNVSFLYVLAEPDADDPGDQELSPQTPKGFWAKMDRLQDRAKELRVDIDAWERTQETLPPEDRQPPPGVYMGTVHSTKGAQWPNVVVQMPKGRFPMTPRLKEGEEPTPEKMEAMQADMQAERRLAYVALTRPSENLHVVCPESYNGKPAGPSSFVEEAGLVVGENVEAPEETDTDESIKTASHFVEDEWSNWKSGDLF